jgi:uncharacterized RDD family membrane protein YckC
MHEEISNPVGFWKRLGAYLLDSLIVSTPLYLFQSLAGLEENVAVSAVIFILSLLYSVLVPVYWHGYNVGKRIVGIRIVKVNGEKLGIGAMIMRSLVASLVYALTLGIGVIISAIMVGTRKDKRAIHDFLAGTYVTSDNP